MLILKVLRAITVMEDNLSIVEETFTTLCWCKFDFSYYRLTTNIAHKLSFGHTESIFLKKDYINIELFHLLSIFQLISRYIRMNTLEAKNLYVTVWPIWYTVLYMSCNTIINTIGIHQFCKYQTLNPPPLSLLKDPCPHNQCIKQLITTRF